MNTLSEAICLLRLSFNFISFQGVLRKWIPHNLHVQSTHTLFQLLSCCWPPDNPALFSLCVWVCKSPLCCVWAVKHPSEQQLPVRSDCYFNSRALGCLRFVCLAVGLGVCPQASPQCMKEEDISWRLKSDSQRCQTQSSLLAGWTPLELQTESFLGCLAAEVKGHLSVPPASWSLRRVRAFFLYFLFLCVASSVCRVSGF